MENLKRFKFYEVGGRVRDELLGIPSKDIDYTVVYEGTTEGTTPIIGSIGILFETLVNDLKNEGFEIFLETPSCQTVRAKFPKDHQFSGVTADFVLARKEIGYVEGTRLPIVVPGTLYDDLQRRDFTVNAIAKDPHTNSYIDPFGGVKDLISRTLRTPIDGEVTFEDDPLRLLRAIRFAVTKGFFISDEIHDIIMKFDYNSKMNVVSKERIREELQKCFKFDSLLTLHYLSLFDNLREYIFTKTNLWLMPTTKQ